MRPLRVLEKAMIKDYTTQASARVRSKLGPVSLAATILEYLEHVWHLAGPRPHPDLEAQASGQVGTRWA